VEKIFGSIWIFALVAATRAKKPSILARLARLLSGKQSKVCFQKRPKKKTPKKAKPKGNFTE
jgi:hypothetical protein